MVGVIVPWNFPMPIAGWGFAPALAAGNTVVLKPAELTPLTALAPGRAGARSRPARARLHGPARARAPVVGERFVTHPDVRKIVFTGSTEVGKSVMAGCAGQVKRVTLELGGKSANIVFADADLERAAATRAHERVRQRRPGLLRPLADPGRAHASTTASWSFSKRPSRPSGWRTLRWSRARWARSSAPSTASGWPPTCPTRPPVAFRGTCPEGPGYWYPPTVLAPVGVGDRAFREEIFGPVVAVTAFRRRGRRHPGWPTTPSTGCPARSGPRTSGGRCGWPGRSRSATCRSTRTRRCGTGRRSAGSSSPASDASSARTRPAPSPTSRTSFIATEG